MAAIRHVWGPFRETLVRRASKDSEVHWHFHGVRSDGRMARWVLIYEIGSRKWSASGLAMPAKDPLPELMDAMLPAPMAELPVLAGKVVDVLRTRLPPTAFATAVRLTAAAR